MRMRTLGLLLLILMLVPSRADAWGFNAHRFIVERAIPLLPPEIRPFFQRYQAAIVEHVIDPDLWRVAGWEEEPPRHFLDLDAYGPYPFTKLPREYDRAVAQYGRSFVVKNGLVPWRSAEIHTKLVEAFTQKSGFARENIKFFSSVLAHYVSDAHVPFHAVVNYDGQLTGQHGIHSRFEAELFDRYQPKLRIDPKPAVPVRSVRDLVFDALIAGFPLAQSVLDADRAAASGREYYDEGYFATMLGKVQPILERRLAESITACASVITAAWIEAGRPALPAEETRTPRRIRR